MAANITKWPQYFERRCIQPFFSLHLAIRLPSSLEHERMYNRDAMRLLIHFVENSKVLYGDSFVSYNVHSLIHLADDCLELGPVDLFSCFEFENHLQQLKNK